MSTKSTFLLVFAQLISISLFAQVTPVWQNYIGGMNSEFIRNSALLSNGDIAIVGMTASINAFENDYGVNTSYSGGLADGFLATINGDGELIWWTLFGGSLEDQIVSLVEGLDGSIWVGGITMGNVPVTENSIRVVNTNSGIADCFVAHFSSDGNLLESSLIGGDGEDRPSGIGLVDGQVVLVGRTSSAGLAVGSNIYDSELNNPNAVFIANIGSVYDLVSFSYFEGNADIVGNDLGKTAFQSQDGNFILYNKSSATEGISTPNAEFPDPLETQNGFLIKLNPSGFPIWGTYANYTSVYRYASALGQDYFATYGMAFQGGQQSTPDSFQQNFLGANDAFLTLWTQSGELVWSTYFGTSDESILGECINSIDFADNRIYFGGYLHNADNLSTTNAWISNFDDINSSSLGVFGWFNLAGELEYCSYVVHPDVQTSVSSITVNDQQLVLGLVTTSLAEWTTSPNADQHYSGETDVCLLAFDLSTATDDLIIEEMVGVYPNPTTDELYFTGMNVIGASVTVYDSQGRVVIKENLNSSLNVSNLDSGYYYGTITTSQGNGRNFKFSKL